MIPCIDQKFSDKSNKPTQPTKRPRGRPSRYDDSTALPSTTVEGRARGINTIPAGEMLLTKMVGEQFARQTLFHNAFPSKIDEDSDRIRIWTQHARAFDHYD